MNELPHLDDHGRSRMIDIGGKAITRRTAIATGRLDTTPAVLELLAANQLRKADALPTARVAGIQGAKRTSELVPLAHTLPLESVTVDFELSTSSVEIRATVAATAKTGAEMEALTAVAIAGLALHDMIKSVDPAAVLGDIHLIEKTGGKRGHWVAGASVPADHGQAVVIVSSTSTAAGTREDLTGPAIAGWLRDHGYQPDEPVVVADADIYQALTDALTSEPVLIVTTGGTGVHPEDRTPEATSAVIERALPGIAEAIRAAGRAATPTASLSRALAGIAGRTIVINLPGLATRRRKTASSHWSRSCHTCTTSWPAADMPDPIGFVTAAPLDKTQLETRIRSRKNGAVVTFEGIVRDHDHGEDVGSLDYEAHPDAERILIDVCTRIAQTTDCDVVAAHRIGHLEIGDVALVTVVAAPHRAEAFAVCGNLVDAIKAEVPIWKHQHFTDGRSEWVGL